MHSSRSSPSSTPRRLTRCVMVTVGVVDRRSADTGKQEECNPLLAYKPLPSTNPLCPNRSSAQRSSRSRSTQCGTSACGCWCRCVGHAFHARAVRLLPGWAGTSPSSAAVRAAACLQEPTTQSLFVECFDRDYLNAKVRRPTSLAPCVPACPWLLPVRRTMPRRPAALHLLRRS